MSLADDELFSLNGRIALITGGSGDIGRAIAESYVRRGARTYICARDGGRCAQVAAEISHEGECFAIAADVSSTEGIRSLVAQISARESSLDILVNNAGASHYASIDDFPEEAWDDVFDLNLKSVFFMTQAFLPLIRKASRPGLPATIINIGSAAGFQVSANEAYSYSTSKAGLNYLTRKLARRLATENITVNMISPGPVDAGLMKSMDEAFRNRLSADVPMGRMAKPEEVAAAAIFLASPAAAYITAAILPVDGGVTGCMR